jgi:photosystem II stability/assembly factor-like uncharacterized protein
MKKIICFIKSFLILLFFIVWIKNCYGQWYQQTLPGNYGGIYCLKFWNENTGWMSTGAFDSIYNCKILKTTNGGNSWFVIKDSLRMYEFQLLDSATIYGRIRNVLANESIYRTFNGGLTWDSVSYSETFGYTGLCFLNKDTGYIGASDSYWGYIFKTTNGGITLNQVHRNDNPSFGYHLFFIREKFNGEYFGYCTDYYSYLYKTTNSGVNWTKLTNGLYNHHVGPFFFLNKDTGWVSNDDGNINYIQHTTNGGISFTNQFTTLFNSYHSGDIYFSSYNKGWAGSDDGNLVFATSNGGNIWGKQVTTQPRTGGIFFLDSLKGWCYSWQVSYTTNGGGIIIDIKKDSNNNILPKSYSLQQNYPNPFNSSTIIEYSVNKKSTIGINIYDISGKSVYDMTANGLEPGNYKLRLDFSSLDLPSGIYFYKFIVASDNLKYLYTDVKKMIYLK